MRYKVDHDYHIHSKLSFCSQDTKQSNEDILRYAEENGMKKICLTDHFWDESVQGADSWYKPQNYAHISSAKPLPQSDNVEFLFGCETELDRYMNLGLSPEHYDLFDFIIIPTTHLHMTGLTIAKEDCTPQGRADCWVKRFSALMDMPLPFGKVGIAHLTCPLIAPASREEYVSVIDLIPDKIMEQLFLRAAELNLGIELNKSDLSFGNHEAEKILRPYRIAKRCGCKFYFGSDSHHPSDFTEAKRIFERTVDFLELEETDKFHISRR